MKLIVDNEEIIGNTGPSKKFTIAASAKAFKILSSSLYKNKPRAIVRELACNAVDAHIMNGQTRPWEITPPTELNPQFIIRDFGPGMSDSTIQELYTTYFGSTKSDSNDFIGGLGLGSKSPFSYTETFTVVSYHGGEVRGYTAMLDAGEPVLRPTFVDTMTADDHTGIEVTVPVKIPDISRFTSEIAYVLRPFKPEQYKVPETISVTPLKQGDFFSQGTGVESSGRCYAIYGNIVYPLTDVPGMEDGWLRLRPGAQFFRFEMGELDIAPSREELSLDEQTVKNICNRVNTLNDDMMAKDIQALHDIKNPRELCRKINGMSVAAVNVLKHRGVKFGEETVDDVMYKYDTSEFYKTISWNCPRAYYMAPSISRAKTISERSTTQSRVSVRSLFDYSQESVYVLLVDTKKSVPSTLRGYQAWKTNKANDDSKLPVRFPKVYSNLITVYAENIDHMQVLEKIKKFMEGDNVYITKLSELEEYRQFDPQLAPKGTKGEKVVRPTTPNVISYTLSEDTGTYDFQYQYLTTQEVRDLEGPFVEVNRDLHSSFPCRASLHNCSASTLQRIGLAAGIEQFYIVKSSAARILKKQERTEDFIQECYDALEEQINTFMKYPYDFYQSGTRFSRNLENKKLSNLAEKIYGSFYKRYSQMNEIVDCLNRARGALPKEQQKLVSEWYLHREKGSVEYSKRMEAFKCKNPALYYVLDNGHSFSDSMLNDIVAKLDLNF